MPEDHTDVVAAAAEHGEDGIAFFTLEWTPRQAAIVFHMAYYRLYGAATAQKFGDGPGDATPGTADEDLHTLDPMAAVSPIDEGKFGLLIG